MLWTQWLHSRLWYR